MNCLECGKAQCTEHRRHAVPVVSVDLKAIRARVARAAPGPWEAGGDDDSADGRMLVHDTRGHVLFDSCEADWSDMDFAAHARQDVPALLDLVDAQARTIEAMVWALLAVEWSERISGESTRRDAVVAEARRLVGAEKK